MTAPESQRFLEYLLFSEHINYVTATEQGLWPALTADFAGLESEFSLFHSQGCVCLQENWPPIPPMTLEVIGSIVCAISTMMNGVNAESHKFIKAEPCRKATCRPKFRGCDIISQAIIDALALPNQGEHAEHVCWGTKQLLTKTEYGKTNSDQKGYVFCPLISMLKPGLFTTAVNDPIFNGQHWKIQLETYTCMSKTTELSFVAISPPQPVLGAGLLTCPNVFTDKPDPTGKNLKEAQYEHVAGQLKYLETISKENPGLRLRFPDLEQEKQRMAPLTLRYKPLVMLMSVMGSSCNISRPEVMNAFLAIANVIQLEIIANTKEGKYLQRFKETVFVPLVWMSLQLLAQMGPLDWTPLDINKWASSNSWKSAAIALAMSPFMMHNILTGSKPPSLKDWKVAEGYPTLPLHEDDAKSFLISAHKEQKERIRDKKIIRDITAPPAPKEPTRTDSDSSEVTDTDISVNSNQSQPEKRWVDLFADSEARAKNPVKEGDAKYTVFIPHVYAIMKEQKRMATQLTKLANLFDEQNKVIVSQAIILREMNSKLTVAKGDDSSSLTTPGINLNNYDEKMATVAQEIQDQKSEQIASDNALAIELQKQTPFKEPEVTDQDIKNLFSGKK